MLRRFAVPALALAAALVTAAPAQAADDEWDIPDGATITVEGRGFGHGRGMSQYGAKHAAEDGVGYRKILAHYYPGTSWDTVAGAVRIWISEGDLDNAVRVAPRSGLVARKVGSDTAWDLGKAQPRAQAWRIVPEGDAVSVLQYLQRGWHRFRRVTGLLEFAAQGKPIRLSTHSGSAAYRGILRSVPSSPGNRITVNVLPMDTYLRGVVPAEVVASTWPQQAQRAQAVAARSYAALKRDTRTDKLYDLDDTPGYQHYLGAGAEHPASDRAVQATAGQILTWAGEPAFAEFTASNGGWSVAGDEPYLQASPDPWDRTKAWEVPFTDTELEAAWPGIGDLTRIEIAGRDGNGDWGGRAGTVTLTGSADTNELTGTEFYQRLGLRSAWFTLHVS